MNKYTFYESLKGFVFRKCKSPAAFIDDYFRYKYYPNNDTGSNPIGLITPGKFIVEYAKKYDIEVALLAAVVFIHWFYPDFYKEYYPTKPEPYGLAWISELDFGVMPDLQKFSYIPPKNFSSPLTECEKQSLESYLLLYNSYKNSTIKEVCDIRWAIEHLALCYRDLKEVTNQPYYINIQASYNAKNPQINSRKPETNSDVFIKALSYIYGPNAVRVYLLESSSFKLNPIYALAVDIQYKFFKEFYLE